MNVRAAFLSALFVSASYSLGAAGPIVDAAEQAEALQAEDKTVEALDALGEATQEIWTDAPLAFRKVVLVESAGGLGTYEERTDRSFRPDEKRRVYVEPVGFGYGRSGDAAAIGFTSDLVVENDTGQIFAEAKDLFSVSVESAPDRREFGMTLAFGVPYLRPGEYKAIFTVRDQNSEKTGSFEVPFTIAAPAGEGEETSGEAVESPAASNAN